MLPKSSQRKAGAPELRFRHYGPDVVKLCLAKMVNFLLHWLLHSSWASTCQKIASYTFGQVL